MANPQPDKYIMISTELFEALCRTRINSKARQLFDFVIRKTYGFKKKDDSISTSQIMSGTGLSRNDVYKARKVLAALNLVAITKKADSYYLNYSINKDYETWQVSSKQQIQ